MSDRQALASATAAGPRHTSKGIILGLGLLLVLGLSLRLLVWRWHEQYPLGGDEREYFEQALTWLQGKGYRELPLMRPPLYTVFLAVVFQLFDSQVQRVRLVQALVSTVMIGLMWLWSRAALGPRETRAAFVTTVITAVCYTFAANATELLTETLFITGLILAFWLIARAAPADGGVSDRGTWRWAACAGLVVGLLSLVRSVALPLVPLACLWLLWQNGPLRFQRLWTRQRLARPVCFGLCAALVILPWTLRNYVVYATPIVIDTTGAENLWLDNALTDRETVKRELYALGEDRGERQRLAMQQGLAAITTDPERFFAKAWREARLFVSFEYFDDLRRRPAIWVPPLEIWMRLLLGDAVWLLVLVAGISGLWLGPNDRLKWLLVPWVAYVLLTGLVFHVELRYRLPIYPALLPYAGWSLAHAAEWLSTRPRQSFPRPVHLSGALATIAIALALLLFHRPYLSEAALLVRKHYHLAQARRLAVPGDRAMWNIERARTHAQTALNLDQASALARVELGRLAEPAQAADWWRAAIDAVPAHPYAHLLLGNALRQTGDEAAARRELEFETRSLEDLQQWALDMFEREPVAHIDLGNGLDLGLITGFYPATDNTRWTTKTATVHQLEPGSELALRLRSPRPGAAPPATVRVLIQDTLLDTLTVSSDWQTYTLAIPEHLRSSTTPWTLRLETPTFRPRDYDRANGDNRALGVQVDWIIINKVAIKP